PTLFRSRSTAPLQSESWRQPRHTGGEARESHTGASLEQPVSGLPLPASSTQGTHRTAFPAPLQNPVAHAVPLDIGEYKQMPAVHVAAKHSRAAVQSESSRHSTPTSPACPPMLSDFPVVMPPVVPEVPFPPVPSRLPVVLALDEFVSRPWPQPMAKVMAAKATTEGCIQIRVHELKARASYHATPTGAGSQILSQSSTSSRYSGFGASMMNKLDRKS